MAEPERLHLLRALRSVNETTSGVIEIASSTAKKEAEVEEEDEEIRRAVLTYVLDNDVRAKGLCLDLFAELGEYLVVKWAAAAGGGGGMK